MLLLDIFLSGSTANGMNDNASALFFSLKKKTMKSIFLSFRRNQPDCLAFFWMEKENILHNEHITVRVSWKKKGSSSNLFIYSFVCVHTRSAGTHTTFFFITKKINHTTEILTLCGCWKQYHFPSGECQFCWM